MEHKRTLITTALPYTNGPVHIGHLAGVYVPADIYARYLRLNGREVALIGGSDEHGVPITLKARKEGVTPQDIVDRYHKLIKESFQGLGISFDVYSRTTSDIHHKTASEFFRHLYDKGEFIEKESMQLFDPEAGQFLADRYVTGECPRWGPHATGICRWTAGNPPYATGFSTSTRNGAPTCTASAKAGSTWGCSHAP